MADRFFFVPSLAVCMLLIFVFEKLLKTDFSTIKINKVFSGNNDLHPAFKYGFIIIIGLLSLRTFYRNKNWKNDESLITHDMPYLENCARAHNYYADILKKKLKDNFDANTEQQMIAHYRKACEITNESYYAWLGLGSYFFDKGKTDEGIEVLDAMLKIFPEQADPNYYFGACLLKKGDAKKAILYLEKSLRLAPEVSSTYYQLSLSYSASGEFEKAENTALTAKQKFGESAMVYDALGTLYFEKNNLEQSTKYTLEMLRLGENPQAVYGKIIGRYQLKKMDDKAALYYNEAVAKGIFRRQ